MTILLSELAELVGGAIGGDGELVITGAAILHTAGPGQITLVDRPALLEQVARSAATAVVVPADLRPEGKAYIAVANARQAFAQIVSRFRPSRTAQKVGIFSGADAAKVIGGETPLDAAVPGYTLVDGRFVKDLLTAAAPTVTNGADTMMAVTQFQSTGKTRLKITGAGKAWLDGKPLALSDDLAPELSAGIHTLAVKLDLRTLPESLRAESPDARFLGN